MKISSLILLTAILFFAPSCKSSSDSPVSKRDTPEKVALKAFKALQNENYAAYAAFYNISEEDRAFVEAVALGFVEDTDWVSNVKTYEILDPKINGNIAYVTEHIIYKNGEEETNRLKLEKVEGKWMLSEENLL